MAKANGQFCNEFVNAGVYYLNSIYTDSNNYEFDFETQGPGLYFSVFSAGTSSLQLNSNSLTLRNDIISGAPQYATVSFGADQGTPTFYGYLYRLVIDSNVYLRWDGRNNPTVGGFVFNTNAAGSNPPKMGVNGGVN